MKSDRGCVDIHRLRNKEDTGDGSETTCRKADEQMRRAREQKNTKPAIRPKETSVRKYSARGECGARTGDDEEPKKSAREENGGGAR